MESPTSGSVAQMVLASVSCTKCGAKGYGTCNCWEQCSCGWTAERGQPCRNPVTTNCSSKVKYGATLNEWHLKILAALDTTGGMLTGDVARAVRPLFGHNNRTHSGAVRSWLLELERQGLVGRLDDQKPVCWVKR